MSPVEQLLPTFEPTPIELVRSMTLQQRVGRAIELLREHEPPEGYYLAFSGGKDSCAIKKLAQLASVKFDAWYNQTTIDPPELVRFIKAEHTEVQWNLPKYGNMMHRVATKPSTPPSRWKRWCCAEYKEVGGRNRSRIFGVRAAESKRRELRWHEVSEFRSDRLSERRKVICPIVYWTDDQLWEFIGAYRIPCCELYNEGFTRLGCVGCPLTSANQRREFARWPAFERNWKRAIIANWERYHALPREDGKPRYHSRFKTGEAFWLNWLHECSGTPDIMREECQTGLLWTNQELEDGP